MVNVGRLRGVKFIKEEWFSNVYIERNDTATSGRYSL